jgi:signal transduction histidine kinase
LNEAIERGGADERLRILFLEDTEADAFLIMRNLRKAGIAFDAVRAATREEYLEALRAAPLDVILSDYALPGFDGMSALTLAQGVCPDTPFIFVTGALGEERAVDTLKAGATDYVLKDRLARLAPAVRRALEEARERRKRRQAEDQVRRRTEELEEANRELGRRGAQLQELSRRLVEIQEAERAAMSRDLHDTAAQALTALGMRLSRLTKHCGNPARAQSEIEELRSLTDQVMLDLRRLAANLRPASLDRYGLVAAVEQYLESLRKQGGIELDLRTAGIDTERLPPDVETALYRIIQEALSNVMRHSGATAAAITIERTDGALTAAISDNGVGLDVDSALRKGRLGLLGMRERAQMLGGALSIESSPGSGARVTVRVPITPVSA